MPLAAILGLATAFLSVVKVLIEKFVPSHVTPKREFRTKKRATDFCGKTISEIAEYGRKKGIV